MKATTLGCHRTWQPLLVLRPDATTVTIFMNASAASGDFVGTDHMGEETMTGLIFKLEGDHYCALIGKQTADVQAENAK